MPAANLSPKVRKTIAYGSEDMYGSLVEATETLAGPLHGTARCMGIAAQIV